MQRCKPNKCALWAVSCFLNWTAVILRLYKKVQDCTLDFYLTAAKKGWHSDLFEYISKYFTHILSLHDPLHTGPKLYNTKAVATETSPCTVQTASSSPPNGTLSLCLHHSCLLLSGVGFRTLALHVSVGRKRRKKKHTSKVFSCNHYQCNMQKNATRFPAKWLTGSQTIGTYDKSGLCVSEPEGANFSEEKSPLCPWTSQIPR